MATDQVDLPKAEQTETVFRKFDADGNVTTKVVTTQITYRVPSSDDGTGAFI